MFRSAGINVFHAVRIRHCNLIYHAAYGDLHPLGAAKRLMSCNNPFAIFPICREQAFIACLYSRYFPCQPHCIQYFRQAHAAVAGHYILEIIVGKFHSVEVGTVRLPHAFKTCRVINSSSFFRDLLCKHPYRDRVKNKRGRQSSHR